MNKKYGKSEFWWKLMKIIKFWKKTPRHSDSWNATPLKEGNFLYCDFFEQLECQFSRSGELILCYFALTLMIWWRSVV